MKYKYVKYYLDQLLKTQKNELLQYEREKKTFKDFTKPSNRRMFSILESHVRDTQANIKEIEEVFDLIKSKNDEEQERKEIEKIKP